ncbi:MAG: response regulator [Firmicutes bacterium]|nr:response regulator [Bacillota bacterium]
MGSVISFKNQGKRSGVLIVDDLLIMRLILSSILKDAGIPIVGQATNGREALDLYVQLNPAVVLLDLLMPEMDGFTTLERLLKIDPKAKVVVCSTLQQKFYITKALKCGATDFLTKPYRPDLVRNLLRKLLAEQQVVHQYPRYLMID